MVRESTVKAEIGLSHGFSQSHANFCRLFSLVFRFCVHTQIPLYKKHLMFLCVVHNRANVFFLSNHRGENMTLSERQYPTWNQRVGKMFQFSFPEVLQSDSHFPWWELKFIVANLQKNVRLRRLWVTTRRNRKKKTKMNWEDFLCVTISTQLYSCFLSRSPPLWETCCTPACLTCSLISLSSISRGFFRRDSLNQSSRVWNEWGFFLARIRFTELFSPFHVNFFPRSKPPDMRRTMLTSFPLLLPFGLRACWELIFHRPVQTNKQIRFSSSEDT